MKQIIFFIKTRMDAITLDGGVHTFPNAIYIGQSTRKTQTRRNCVVIVTGNNEPDNTEYIDSIVMGYHATTNAPHDHSIIIVPKEVEWQDPTNNVNIGNFIEGNSETKEMTFPGTVRKITITGEFTQKISTCTTCLQKDTHGIYDVCIDCIRVCVLQFRAKESWAEQNGDPVRNCLDMIKTLQDEVKQCKEEIEKLQKQNSTITSGEYLSQYL